MKVLLEANKVIFVGWNYEQHRLHILFFGCLFDFYYFVFLNCRRFAMTCYVNEYRVMKLCYNKKYNNSNNKKMREIKVKLNF